MSLATTGGMHILCSANTGLITHYVIKKEFIMSSRKLAFQIAENEGVVMRDAHVSSVTCDIGFSFYPSHENKRDVGASREFQLVGWLDDRRNMSMSPLNSYPVIVKVKIDMDVIYI